MPHIHILMEVSESTYKEINDNLKKAACHKAFLPNGVLDLNGILVRRLEKQEKESDPLEDLPALRVASEILDKITQVKPKKAE